MGALPSGFTSTKREADENVSPARNVSAVLVHGQSYGQKDEADKEGDGTGDGGEAAAKENRRRAAREIIPRDAETEAKGILICL